MGVPRAQLDRLEALETLALEAVADLLPGLVAEGISQRHPEEIGSSNRQPRRGWFLQQLNNLQPYSVPLLRNMPCPSLQG